MYEIVNRVTIYLLRGVLDMPQKTSYKQDICSEYATHSTPRILDIQNLRYKYTPYIPVNGFY